MNKKNLGLILRILLVGMVVVLLFQHFYIKDFRIITPDVLYVSGQPRKMDFTRLLYKYHIAAIVNVRSTQEHQERNWRNEELVWMRENAVPYFELPIDKEHYFPDPQTQDKFLLIMNDKKNLPVLLHGYGDDKRVAMLTAVWLKKNQGQTTEETLAQIKKIIDDRPLTQQEIDFVRNLQ
jgi:protein tyrosine/serine phosphatase